jgi:choline kinase
MNIIILGDKYQKRMKSKGCVGLIKINKQNFLSHQYNVLRNRFPDSKIVYVYGFDNKRFASYVDKNHKSYQNMIFIHNKDFDKYNTSYSLSLVSDYLNEDCMILFGDSIIKTKEFSSFKQKRGSQVFMDKENKTKLGCIINNGKIENISYDLDNYLSDIYFISKQHIDIFRKLINDPNNHNNFIFEILNKVIDLNQTIIPYYI